MGVEIKQIENITSKILRSLPKTQGAEKHDKCNNKTKRGENLEKQQDILENGRGWSWLDDLLG